ncbi:ankyrin-3 [Elysia marginata]|uniref:Ankyrin-3 n=1 Tax=Elysia marginata TaxID=1093978 RepID=A0AAV4JKN0_9GAST|nr:ankyrin-3 [Elysia marginata]
MDSETDPADCHASSEESKQNEITVKCRKLDEESDSTSEENPSLPQRKTNATKVCKGVTEKCFNNRKQAFSFDKPSFAKDSQKPGATQDIPTVGRLSDAGAENDSLNGDEVDQPLLPGQQLLAAAKAGDLGTIDVILQQQKKGGEYVLSQEYLNASLLEACRAGRKFIVQKLVRSGAKVNAEWYKNCATPLHIAAQQGFVDIADFLLSKGADANALDSEGNTALILAMNQAGSCDLLNLLLVHKVELHCQNSQGMTALMKAVEVMDIDAVRLLLLARASSGKRNKHGKTARDIAATLGIVDIYDSLTFEVEEHHHIYQFDHSEALTKAVLRNQTEAVKILLDCRTVETKSWHTQSKIKQKEKTKIFAALMELVKSICSDAEMKKGPDDTKLEIAKILVGSGMDFITTYRCHYACFTSVNEAVNAATRSGVYELVKLLCQMKNIEVNLMTNDYSALMIAAEIGRLDIVKLLLGFGADPGLQKCRGEMALTYALTSGHIECAQFLIEKHKPPQSELQRMARKVAGKGQLDSLKFLARHFDLNRISQGLMESGVLTGDTEIVQFLIDRGADVNTVCDFNFRRPALLIALRNREVNLLNMVTFLVERGAHVNRTTPLDSPLVTALEFNCELDVLRYLLEQGADVNEVGNDDGETPLTMALHKYSSVSGNSLSDILELLLEAGADKNKPTTNGDTPLHRAIYKGEPEIVKQLIDFGADLEARDSTGLTPFLLAAKEIKPQVITVLKNCGANTKAVDNEGRNGLLLSLLKHHCADEETLRLLSADKDEVNLRTCDGLTPLIRAAMHSHVKAIKIFLECGGDLHACNNEQETALSILFKSFGFRNGSRDVISTVDMLIRHGALHSLPKRHCLPLYCKIMSDERELVQLLVTHGMAPICMDFKEIIPPERLKDMSDTVLSNCSLLAAALVRERLAIARYFLENWFLTPADVVGSVEIKEIRGSLLTSAQTQRFLDDHFSQPMSLVLLSFVTVSAQLGDMIGREERVRKLPLPTILQDQLLFKKEVYPMDFIAADGNHPTPGLLTVNQSVLVNIVANGFRPDLYSYDDVYDDDYYDYSDDDHGCDFEDNYY